MAKKKKFKTRAEPMISWLTTTDAYNTLCVPGYTRLSDNPEVRTCVRKIAELISSMTIHLMESTDKGDVRIKDELSRKIDVNPYKYMTRKNWMYNIVNTMLLEGDGNCIVYPHINRQGFIEDLEPLKPSAIYIYSTDDAYAIRYGQRDLSWQDVLHFLDNPDPNAPYRGRGFTVELRDVVNTLKQAGATKKAFMEDKWKPSIIVSVDAMTEELTSEEGRDKILKQYISETSSGKPWVVPAEFIKVETLKPLTLNDLAISDTIKLDKQTVAALIGVPAFFVGVGEYNKDEYNNFVDTKILPIAKEIEQELTKKLLYSPNRYFKFNPRSLYNYSLNDLVSTGVQLVDRTVMTRNELRDWIGMTPKEGLDEMIILENYIPVEKLGDQEKLKGGE